MCLCLQMPALETAQGDEDEQVGVMLSDNNARCTLE